MNFTVFEDLEQRSPEWSAMRAGLVTGSCAPAIIAVRKKGTGELAVRKELRQKLVCERLTGLSLDKTFDRKPDAMQHGVDTEPDAVAAYEAHTGRIVQRVGFIRHNHLKAGCSPDGYIGEFEGLVETKCPTSMTHLETVMAGVIPEDHAGQLLHSLWLTGAQWVDFVSFDPRFAEPLRLFIRRMNRADVDLAAYELALTLFLNEVDADFEKASTLAGQLATSALTTRGEETFA